MKRFLIFLLLFPFGLFAQSEFDSIRVMSYNLLFYGEQTSFCTSSNNNINDKDGYFKTISQYVKPDILVVNEMGASVIYADRIIENVLNTDGESRYKRAGIQNNSFSNLVNAIFYDKNKLGERGHEKVTKALNNSSIVRAIDVLKLFYKDSNLTPESDTTFIYVVAMHLKAGSSNSDEDERDLATEAVMEYLSNNYPAGYYVLAGDLNVKTSSEEGYKNLVNASGGDYRFYDPIDRPGNWNNNANFADVHTQSTHTSGSCFSLGGMDDRFDFVLLSGQVMEDTGAVRYIDGSYTTIGNDGGHFNQSLLQGSNNSVPAAVRSSLYEMSDHLPVRLDLRIERLEEPEDTLPPQGIDIAKGPSWELEQGFGQYRLRNIEPGTEVQLFDMRGVLLNQERASSNLFKVHEMAQLTPGVYIIRTTHNGRFRSAKLVVSVRP